MKKNKKILPFAIFIFIFIAVICTLIIRLGFGVSLKLISSFILVFFLPGIVWSFAIFGENKKISWILRIVFAFAFSILTIPLVEFYLNHLFKVEITRKNIFIEIIILSIIGVLIYFIKYMKANIMKIAIFIAAFLFVFSPINSKATVLPFDYSSIKIIKVSGDKQTIIIGENANEVKAKVIDENSNPLPGTEVIFTLYDKNNKIIGVAYSTITDNNGYATFIPELKEKGKYTVKAELKNGSYVIFDLNVETKGKISSWFWLLLLLIPLLILLLVFRTKKHQVYDLGNQEGLSFASVIIKSNNSEEKKLSTNSKGFFKYHFSNNQYEIKIEKEGFELNLLDNHPEFNKSGDSWFYFEITNTKEKLRFGMKRIKE